MTQACRNSVPHNRNRRAFLAASGGLLLAGCATAPRNETPGPVLVPTGKDPHTEAVLRALLAMQRMNWEQGLAAQAMFELGREEELISLARAAVLRQREGRLATIGGYDPINDAAVNGEPVLRAGEISGAPLFKRAADAMIGAILNSPHRAGDGLLYHTMPPAKWVLPDALYMAPPFLCAMGRPEEAIRQVNALRRRLWNQPARLYSYIWDDGAKRMLRPEFRGPSNGFAAAGMVRVLDLLPPSFAGERRELAGQFKEHLEGCLRHLRPDGFFHYTLDRPETFIETNTAQMIAYAIYRGVAGGWIEKTHLTDADRIRRAAHAQVGHDGLVQDVCGAPHFNQPGVSAEGQAFFLLMEAAARAT